MRNSSSSGEEGRRKNSKSTMRFAKENWIFLRAGTSSPKSPNYLNTNKLIVKKYLPIKKWAALFPEVCLTSWQVELLLVGWLLASATCMKGLHFSLFTFTSAISYLAEVYLHIHQTRQSRTTASLCCFLFFFFYNLERF